MTDLENLRELSERATPGRIGVSPLQATGDRQAWLVAEAPDTLMGVVMICHDMTNHDAAFMAAAWNYARHLLNGIEHNGRPSPSPPTHGDPS